MAKKLTSLIYLMIFCTILSSSAQLFLKLGTSVLPFSLQALLSNAFFWLGILLYAVGAIVMVLALKQGDLSLVYPIISLSFIWVALLSMAFLGESLALLQWLGIMIIISGVALVTRGAKNA